MLTTPVMTTIIEHDFNENFRVSTAEINGHRNSMEDAHVIEMKDNWGYFGILDGHGGQQCSKWCAQRLHEKLQAEGCPSNDAEAKQLILTVDREYLATGMPSGSTATMCAVRTAGNGRFDLHVINAGDSRVILGTLDGQIVDGGGTEEGLTTDHKVSPLFPLALGFI